jgi:hypothetical protein
MFERSAGPDSPASSLRAQVRRAPEASSRATPPRHRRRSQPLEGRSSGFRINRPSSLPSPVSLRRSLDQAIQRSRIHREIAGASRTSGVVRRPSPVTATGSRRILTGFPQLRTPGPPSPWPGGRAWEHPRASAVEWPRLATVRSRLRSRVARAGRMRRSSRRARTSPRVTGGHLPTAMSARSCTAWSARPPCGIGHTGPARS